MIPRDKILHFAAGLIIGLSAILLPWYLSFAAVIIAGVGKEIKDQIVYGGFDIYDLLFTIAGGIVSVGFIEVFK